MQNCNVKSYQAVQHLPSVAQHLMCTEYFSGLLSKTLEMFDFSFQYRITQKTINKV